MVPAHFQIHTFRREMENGELESKKLADTATTPPEHNATPKRDEYPPLKHELGEKTPNEGGENLGVPEQVDTTGYTKPPGKENGLYAYAEFNPVTKDENGCTLT